MDDGAGDDRAVALGAGAAGSFIVMDAPPPQEDVASFVQVAALLHGAGLNAPQVIEQDAEHGFLLLSDLGSDLYLQALQDAARAGHPARADALMRDAIRALTQWQLRGDASALPPYDDALLRRELALFPQWCVAVECGAVWTPDAQQQWQEACDLLVGSALAQPVVAVHRDYMPRNLMVCGGSAVTLGSPANGPLDGPGPGTGIGTGPAADLGVAPEVGPGVGPEPRRASSRATGAGANPGILDFQDAVRGPITYDIASLLRDAFISWEEEQEIDWAVRYWQAARQAGLPLADDFGEFWRQLEWMGLQRHLKVLGIFCRLKHRDAKPRYSEDLPRFFNYAHKVAARYNALRPLSRLLEPLMGAQRIETFG